MADRFYCPEPPVDGSAILEGDEARHLIRVRRVGIGGIRRDFRRARLRPIAPRLSALGRDRVELAILGPSESDHAADCSLTLATAVPKGERFDWLVEKATELGVARLIPLVTERSVVDPRSAKLDRLRRVIVEAAKQCRRDRLMELDPPTAWDSLVRSSGRPSMRFVAHPGGRRIASLGLRPGADSAILAIGPEGGFTTVEVDRAIEAGWQAVGLGPTILRVETAALAGMLDAPGDGRMRIGEGEGS